MASLERDRTVKSPSARPPTAQRSAPKEPIDELNLNFAPKVVRRTTLAVIALLACLVIFTAYAPGLGGPLVLDDMVNLSDLQSLEEGEITAARAILNNNSGPLGRPVSMASFVVDLKLWGLSVWHFKLTNIMLHLITGLLIWRLLQRLLPKDIGLAAHVAWLAPLLAIWWLLTPIQVSTVLYVVQRMALLSGLFVIAGLWLFVSSREAIERGNHWGIPGLWVGVPLLSLLAVLAKESGALALPLMAWIEWVYFSSKARRRPKTVKLFFFTFIGLPAVAGVAVLTFRPDLVLGGYEGRAFTLLERALTQPRVLWDYVFSIAIPNTTTLGLFNDQYRLSTSLLTPPTTVIAIGGWLFALGISFALRRRQPAILFGLVFFLIAHAMESTILPLEMVFEHRNYIAALGIVLATSGLLALALKALPPPTIFFSRAMRAIPVLFLVTLWSASFSRATSWASPEAFYAQAERSSPTSPRLQSFLAGMALDRGDLDAALAHISLMEKGFDADQNTAAALWRIFAYCAIGQTPPATTIDDFDAEAVGEVGVYEGVVWESVTKTLELRPCPGLDLGRLIEIAQRWTDANPQARNRETNWRPRVNLGRLLAASGDLASAADTMDSAWIDSGFDRGVGVLNFQLHASLDDAPRCAQILKILETRRGEGDRVFDRGLDDFARALKDGTIGGSVKATLILDAHQDLIDRLDVQTPATDAETPQRP